MQRIFLYAAVLLLFVSCTRRADMSFEPEWIESGIEINDNYADVFWFCGTLVNEAKDSLGNSEYRIRQTEDQKNIFKDVALRTRESLFLDSLNFFSPYYHQFTMESLSLPKERFESLCKDIADEAYNTFHYYMENLNNGRPYVLAGLSQGGMLVLEVLKRMTDAEYANMVAAYSLGYGISSEDLKNKHIIPAKGKFDKGVTISFNSVVSTEGIWSFVQNNTEAIINPVNWTTDCTPATFIRRTDTLTVHIDSLYKVLIVEGLSDSRRMPMDEPWVQDNLHFLEASIYAPLIQRNILDRVYR